MTRRRIATLAILLVVMAALSIVVIIKGRPATEQRYPLEKVDESKISRIDIVSPERITLERAKNEWRVTFPINDRAEQQLAQRIVTGLKNFYLESVISSNKDKFETFGVDDKKGTHIVVSTAKGNVLDGILGKEGTIYGTVYFRFTGKNDVYISNNLQTWLIKRPIRDFRQKQVVDTTLDSLRSFRAKLGATSFEINRSSMSWIVKDSGKAVGPEWVSQLLQRLWAIQSDDFVEQVDDAKAGFDHPVAQFAVIDSSSTADITIGKTVPVKGVPANRYVKTDGRPGAQLVTTASVDELLKYLKAHP